MSSLVACSKSNAIFEDEATRVTSLPYQHRKSLGSLPGKLRKGGGGGQGLLEVVVAISCNSKHKGGVREWEKGVKGRVGEP